MNKKIILWALGWILFPYIPAGILTGKTVKRKTNNNLVSILSGVFVFFMVFCFCLVVMVPSEHSEEKEIKKINVLDSKTTSKPEQKKETKTTSKPKKKKETKIAAKTTVKKTTKKKEKTARIKNITLILEVMKKSYKDVAKIEYDKNTKTIKIIPIDENFMLEALQAKNGKKEYISSWNIIVDELVKSSKSIDKSYSLTMHNTLNDDNILLMVQDGLVLYNYIN